MADQKQKKDAEGEKSPKENQKADRKQKNKQEKKQDKKQEKQTKMPEPGVIGVVTGSMLSGLGSGKAVVGGKGVSSNQNIKNAYDKNRNRLKCFVGDTLVLTKEGYYPIKEVHTGVLVYSRNVQTGEDGWQEVEHMSVSGTHTIYEICLDGEETLKTTAYHPVFIKGQGWVNAIQLQAGDLVETLEDAAKITDVKKVRYEEPVDVYNLQVAKWASFFVSKRQALVHNCAMDQGLSKDAATGYEKIIDFREQNGINAYDKSKKNTVAHIQVEGKNYFGANSNLLVPPLKEKVLERNRRLFGEIKWVPPMAKPPKHPGRAQSLTHAEASALLRVSENVKPMPKKITMTVDRVTCNWCRRELPVIMRHLGVEELEIYSGDLDEPAADSKKREPLLLKAADPVPE